MTRPLLSWVVRLVLTLVCLLVCLLGLFFLADMSRWDGAVSVGVTVRSRSNEQIQRVSYLAVPSEEAARSIIGDEAVDLVVADDFDGSRFVSRAHRSGRSSMGCILDVVGARYIVVQVDYADAGAAWATVPIPEKGNQNGATVITVSVP